MRSSTGAKLTLRATLIAVCVLLLSGCSAPPLTEAEQRYKDDCVKVLSNISYSAALTSAYDPALNQDIGSSSDDYFVTYVGNETRRVAQSQLTAVFPVITKSVFARFKTMTRAEFLANGIGDFWQVDDSQLPLLYDRELLAGTSFSPPASVATADPDQQLAYPFDIHLFDYLDGLNPSKRFSGCLEAAGENLGTVGDDYSHGKPIPDDNNDKVVDGEDVSAFMNQSNLSLEQVYKNQVAIYSCSKYAVATIFFLDGPVKCAKEDQ